MLSDKVTESHNHLADQAAHSADQVVRSTQRVANQALDGLAGSVRDLRQQAAPLLNRATEQASVLAQRGVDAVRAGSRHVRNQSLRASDSTLHYVREEPVKSMLIAAAVGAALMALLSGWGGWAGWGGSRERR
jgi:ElaB/YqjD/DUF883 family membrane-anchored ribosome-binding protein